MTIALGPLHFVTGMGGLDAVAKGVAAPPDLDALIPRSPSLRRASAESKRAVIAATEAMKDVGGVPPERVGLYVAQQHGAHDACADFLTASWKQGPRLVSPMLFSESVANIGATHLSLALRLTGVVLTFTGARAAGIQALAAARDDIESGVTDAGLVVVNSMESRLVREAYGTVYRRDLSGLKQTAGAVAFAVRRAGGLAVAQARACCLGPRPQERAAAIAEVARSVPASARVVVSALALEQDAVLADAGRALGRAAVAHPAPESFVLDPFVQLGLDALRAPEAAARAVVCAGEDGTVGVLVVEGRVSAS